MSASIQSRFVRLYLFIGILVGAYLIGRETAWLRFDNRDNGGPTTRSVAPTPRAESSDNLRDALLSSAPIALSLSTNGAFINGGGWTLDVSPDGSAELTIRAFPETKRSFAVTEEQMDELRAILLRERFFALEGEYGQMAPHTGTRTLTVSCDGARKTVRLHFLMNWVYGNRGKLIEPARAVCVWMHARQWFDDGDAVDFGQSDQLILSALPER